MYARTDAQKTGIPIPDGYDGTALIGSDAPSAPAEPREESAPPRAPKEIKISPIDEPAEEETAETGAKIPFSGRDLFSGLGDTLKKYAGLWNLPVPALGRGGEKRGFTTEDYLLLGLAGLLLFSKKGDKQAALMILLLVFLF